MKTAGRVPGKVPAKVPASVLVGALLVGGAVACTSSPAPDPTPSPAPMRWTAVDLPDDALPLLVRAGAGVVLVAARAGERAAMYRITVPGAGVPTPVALAPHSVYAPGARWVDLATDGSRVLAVGRAAGGAHGLPRWTVWEGTPDRVVEEPQPFETFGGPWSGGLAAATLGRSAVVAGTWDDDGPGLDVRLWTQASPTVWDRLPTSPVLTSTPSRLPQPAAAAGTPGLLLLAGSVTELGEGSAVLTRATAWTAPGATGPWIRHDLPTRSTSARATGAACTGQTCWLVGLDGDAPSAWEVTRGAVTGVPLPEVEGAPGAPPVVSVAGDAVWVATAGRDDVVLAHREGRRWVAVQGPPGRPVSLAASPGRLHLVTATTAGTRLWTAPTG